MEMLIDLVPDSLRKDTPLDPLNIPFGSIYTDHMFIMEYSDGEWHNPRIQPYQSLTLDPAALVLHYGQGIFEGMKAYRRGDNAFLFRPRKNFERMNTSAERMVMPPIDPDFCIDALRQLISIEKHWIPDLKGTSLYIRPTMIASEARLGVRPSNEYLFYIILSPVGPYFKEGFNPVKIYVSDQYIRAAKGGIGNAKTMGNYAASLLAGKVATEAGCSQVMYLDAEENRYIEESGTMNLFVLLDDELVTPPLTGTILPGITRASVIHIAKEWGIKVNEKPIPIDEVTKGVSSGKVKEIFGAGTAAIIAPIGALSYQDTEYVISNGNVGDLSRKLFDEISGIQCGEIKDTRGWVVPID